MSEPTRRLRELAERIVAAYERHAPTRAALLAGSAARGDADFYSDLDLILYADEVPSAAATDAARTELGGGEPVAIGERSAEGAIEQYELDGVACQVGYAALRAVEADLERLLERGEELDTPLQKLPSGLLEGLVLFDDGALEPLRARAAVYPEALRRAMVERHWRFFPLWWYGEALAARDAELWRLDLLLEAAFNLLGVLAGTNRVYYTRFELKRLRALEAKLPLAPPRLAARLESLFRLEPAAAAEELGCLVAETRELVARELPDVELPLRHPPGTRQKPWG